MLEAISIRDLFTQGVVLAPHQAIAVVEQLLEDSDSEGPPRAAGAPRVPPRIDDVELRTDGYVRWNPPRDTPSVPEMVALLRALLRDTVPEDLENVLSAQERGSGSLDE